MSTNFTEPMGWDATGVAPSDNLKTNGFNAGDKPPASVFNYFLNNTSTCLKELQQNARDVVFIVNATSTDGMAYTATDERISELRTGLTILMIPDKTTTKIADYQNLITLNINGLGAKSIMRKVSMGTATNAYNVTSSWLFKDIPTLLTYTGSRWVALDFTKPAANDLYGTVGYDKGGTSANSRELALAYFGGYTDDQDQIGGSHEIGLPWSIPLCFKTISDTGLLDNGNTTGEWISYMPPNTSVAFTYAVEDGIDWNDAPCDNGYCILFCGNGNNAFGGVMYSNAGDVYSYSYQNDAWYEIYTSNRSVDSTPIANSDNLITSGGVYSAVKKYMHSIYINCSQLTLKRHLRFTYTSKDSAKCTSMSDVIAAIQSLSVSENVYIAEAGASGEYDNSETISGADITVTYHVASVGTTADGELKMTCFHPSTSDTEHTFYISSDDIVRIYDTVQPI